MMKRLVLLPLLVISFFAKAQFNYTLTGSPVNITGWTIGGSATTSGTDINLTQSTTSQAGYIYYTTPVNLTGCSQFTVTFDFQMTNSSNPPADGIAFWYITNPPSGFTVGSGIGLPTNPNGLVLVLDTYDNDGNVNNPLVSLRYLSSTNYVEGSATGLIGPDVLYQSFITNAQWHTCVLNYNNGAMDVSFDGNPPVISGNYSIAINGYFGFSASTGASWSTHSIKNVSITGNTLIPPVANSPVSFCQYTTSTALTATGTNLNWYSTPLGGSPLVGAPVPGTSTPGTYYWYVSQTIPGCGESNRDTVVVNIVPKPTSPVLNYKNTYCAGEAFVPFVAPNTLWYNTQTGGSGNPIPPTVNTSFPGTHTYYVSQVINGCESDRSTIVVKVLTTPNANYTYNVKYGCHGDTVIFQNLSTNALSYQWDLGDGTGDTAHNTVTHIYPTQGIYNVTLKTLNANGCKDSIKKAVNLIHLLDAAFKADDDTICKGGIVTFINQSTTGPVPSYFWDFGDGQKDSTKNPVHTFNEPGIYSVRLIAMNYDLVDCMDTTYHSILVDSLPTVSFTMSDSILCEGMKIEFNANYTHNGNSGIEWSFGDNLEIYASNPIQHTFDTVGQFTVLMHASYRACANMDLSRNIQIKPYPKVDLGPDTSMCPNAAPLFLFNKAINMGSSTAWKWNTGETSPSIMALHPGIYSLNMKMDGCSTDDSIEIIKACYLDIPNAFTPNDDGLDDYFLPRQLLGKSLTTFKMSIYNRWGELLFETDKNNGRGWNGKFNDKDQPTGVYVYLIEVAFKDGNTEKYQGNVTLLR